MVERPNSRHRRARVPYLNRWEWIFFFSSLHYVKSIKISRGLVCGADLRDNSRAAGRWWLVTGAGEPGTGIWPSLNGSG